MAITGVEPQPGATGIEPNSLISIAFNKPINPLSIQGNFQVIAKGAKLPGRYAVVPGVQIATFAVSNPLPESATLTEKRPDKVPGL